MYLQVQGNFLTVKYATEKANSILVTFGRVASQSMLMYHRGSQNVTAFPVTYVVLT